MKVTLHHNGNGESFAFQLVFSTGRRWVIRYVDSARKLESFKGTVCMCVSLHDKEIDDFFANVSTPCEARFVKSLFNADMDCLCRGMMHIEKAEFMAYVGLMIEKHCPVIRIAKYVGADNPSMDFCNGKLYPVVEEKSSSCFLLNGHSVPIKVSNRNLQFTI